MGRTLTAHTSSGSKSQELNRVQYILSHLADSGFAVVFGLETPGKYVAVHSANLKHFSSQWQRDAFRDLAIITEVAAEISYLHRLYWKSWARYKQCARRKWDTNNYLRWPSRAWPERSTDAFPLEGHEEGEPVTDDWASNFPDSSILLLTKDFAYPSDSRTKAEQETVHTS
jgi:hypothetical protein